MGSVVRFPEDKMFSIFTLSVLLDRDRLALQGFLANVRFTTSHRGENGRVSGRPQTLREITSLNATDHSYRHSHTTVAQHFQRLGVSLQYPNYVCIKVYTLNKARFVHDN